MSYEYHEFPKWKHSSTGESKIVQDAEEESSLDGEWFDFIQERDEYNAAQVQVPTSKKRNGTKQVSAETETKQLETKESE